MTQYIVRRILLSIPVLIGITIVNFLFMHAAPGDPITMMAPINVQGAHGGAMSQEVRAVWEKKLGLDQPLPVQYIKWLGQILQGNFGRSISYGGLSVSAELLHRLWPTLKLTLTALVISVVVGLTVGTVSALRQYSLLDYVATVASFASVSVPGFFLALVFIYVFALQLNWFPTSGMATLGQQPTLRDSLAHLIMPATVLGLEAAASLVRYTRSSVLEVLRQDYIVTARAKGLRGQAVIWRHALRNALLPFITIISLRLPGLFGGAVIIEQVFHWQGIGVLAVHAVFSKDYPILMGVNTILAVFVLAANLLADIAYAIADPRIRYE